MRTILIYCTATREAAAGKKRGTGRQIRWLVAETSQLVRLTRTDAICSLRFDTRSLRQSSKIAGRWKIGMMVKLQWNGAR